MRRYQTLLFDVDDTLLDFHAAQDQALDRLFDSVGIAPTTTVKTAYATYNQSLWEKLEKGELTRDELMATRFPTFFKEYFQKELPNNSLNERYLNFLAEGHQEVEGAKALLENLNARGYELYIVTNGVRFIQEKRLRAAKFTHYFKDVFISETLGAQKPSPLFFERAFAQIKDFDKEHALIIGDSLSSDMLGGQNAGIDTLWYNPKKQTATPDLKIDWEVASLAQVEQILAQDLK